MANQYSDLFTYGVFGGIRDWHTVSYKNVKLIKDMCGKKNGDEIDEIILDTCTGKFTIPRTPAKKSPVTLTPPVEFKGKHTRFEEEPPSPPKKKRATKTEKEKVHTTVFKVYSGRKIHKVEEFDDEAYEIVTDKIGDILEGYDLKNHFSVNDNGCIVMCGIWDQFELKKRIKTESGYSFARIV